MREWLERHVHFLALMVAVVGVGATLLTVPEVRWRLLGDAKYKPEYLQPTSQVPDTAVQPTGEVSHQRTSTPPVLPPIVEKTNIWAEIRPASVRASSVLPTSRVASYGPELAFDGQTMTVWV